MRHIPPFVRARGRVIPSLGTAAALRIAGIEPGDVRLDGTVLWMRDRAMPMSWNRVASTAGDYRYLWGLINFRGPAYPRGITYKSYSFFDLMYSYEQIAAGQKPNIDPSLFRDKVVFVGISAKWSGGSLRDAIRTRDDAGDPDSCGGSGRHSLESIPASD
jgi:CHASE2 domain-containing sensor protein